MSPEAPTASVAPADPIGPSPLRRARSIRRTSTIDTNWPEGPGGPMVMRGRARDIVTLGEAESVRILGEDEVWILASPSREILAIDANRRQHEVRELVGQRGGGRLRGVIAEILPEELADATPLNLLLDDFSGASLVAGWAWSRWMPDWQTRLRASAQEGGQRTVTMEGICSGFRPGASSLLGDGKADTAVQSSVKVLPLARADDVHGWHSLSAQEGVGMRRARRIDAWVDGGLIKIDSGFQDSATDPQGGPGRIAVHEYHVEAAADAETMTLQTVVAHPRVLPYRECPDASANVVRIVGTPLVGLRRAVPQQLAGTIGCTHLNDVLRAIADVPMLVTNLKRTSSCT